MKYIVYSKEIGKRRVIQGVKMRRKIIRHIEPNSIPDTLNCILSFTGVL